MVRDWFYRIASIVFVVAFISGCRMDTRIDLYTGDISDVVDKSDSIMTTGTLSINVSSHDECIKNKDRIEVIVSKYVVVSEVQGCHDRNMDSFLDFSVRYPVSLDLTGDLIQLQLLSDGKGGVNVDYVLSRGKFNSLNAEVSREFSEDIDLEDSSISLNIINDLRSVWVVYISAAFVNGNAEVNGVRELNRRDSLSILFSDVHSSSVSVNDRVHLVKIEVQ